METIHLRPDGLRHESPKLVSRVRLPAKVPTISIAQSRRAYKQTVLQRREYQAQRALDSRSGSRELAGLVLHPRARRTRAIAKRYVHPDAAAWGRSHPASLISSRRWCDSSRCIQVVLSIRAYTQSTRPMAGHQPITLSVLGSTPKSTLALETLGTTSFFVTHSNRAYTQSSTLHVEPGS